MGTEKLYTLNHSSEELNKNNSDLFFKNLVWMTTEEAAKYLRKTVGALRTMVCRGHIRCRKYHRRLYFKRTELDLILESSHRKGDF